MVRECLGRLAWLVAVAPLAGCSLVLDFSASAVPIDAQIDAPYTQAECDYKEPNETPDQAAVITAADTGPAAICAGGATDDHDFYKFSVPGLTASVTVKITFTNRPTGDLDLKLYDATGATVLAQSRGFTDEEQIVCPASSPACAPLAAGDYVFEVFPALAGSVNSYNIALTITPM